MIKIAIPFYLVALFFNIGALAQVSLREKLDEIVSSKRADVGVSIMGIEDGDTLSLHGSKHYPMQSVFKFHVALMVLHLIDEGKLSLEQKIAIKKEDLLPNAWSPLREKYPEGNVTSTLREILTYTVAWSDNSGCDILFRLVGGPLVVNDFIHKLGVTDCSIQSTEEEMHKEWSVQFLNWTTPAACTQLLTLFYNHKIISGESYKFLWEVMVNTTTGIKRIKGGLPSAIEVAHKTGTSDTSDQGITAAVNDIGIVTLPNGKHFAISIFVSNSLEPMSVNEEIIASITKAAWEYFNDK